MDKIVSDLSRNMLIGEFDRYDFLKEQLLVLNARAIFVGFYFLLELGKTL